VNDNETTNFDADDEAETRLKCGTCLRTVEGALTEDEMLDRLRKAKRVFLLEPGYARKYIPLGLAKIATFVKQNGGRVWFGRGYYGPPVDLICVTSLFTYDSGKVVGAIKHAEKFGRGTPVLVGGVYASLMPKDIHARTSGKSDLFLGYSQKLDQIVPDYSLAYKIEDPWPDFSFTFTSRGCPNKCAYCSVWRIESTPWINPSWRDHILDSKPCAMLSDNNLSATPPEHLHEVIDFLVKRKKKVIFDNGFDVKHITDDMAARLGKVKFTRSGMRVAFDRIEEDGVFQAAVERLKAGGVPKGEILAYCLFNFTDTPKEAYYRMTECARLGIRPYPQQYTPLNQAVDRRTKRFIGKHWTDSLVKVFRHYWLMAGIYTKYTFESYAKEQDKVALTMADWDAWNA
jgi:hypothetical protein